MDFASEFMYCTYENGSVNCSSRIISCQTESIIASRWFSQHHYNNFIFNATELALYHIITMYDPAIAPSVHCSKQEGSDRLIILNVQDVMSVT